MDPALERGSAVESGPSYAEMVVRDFARLEHDRNSRDPLYFRLLKVRGKEKHAGHERSIMENRSPAEMPGSSFSFMKKTVVLIIVLLALLGAIALLLAGGSEKGVSLQAVAVYFGDTKKNIAGECNEVFPVARVIPQTQAVGQAALQQLFLGPTDAEKAEGYFTSLNPGVELLSLRIASGTAYADFSKALEEGVGGSCKVAAIRAQITQTLKQFPTVQNVIISVEGRIEDALQP